MGARPASALAGIAWQAAERPLLPRERRRLASPQGARTRLVGPLPCPIAFGRLSHAKLINYNNLMWGQPVPLSMSDVVLRLSRHGATATQSGGPFPVRLTPERY